MVADWVMLTCMRKRDLYTKQKVTYLVESPDSEPVSNHCSEAQCSEVSCMFCSCSYLYAQVFNVSFVLPVFYFYYAGFNGDHLWHPMIHSSSTESFFVQQNGMCSKHAIKMLFRSFTKAVSVCKFKAKAPLCCCVS